MQIVIFMITLEKLNQTWIVGARGNVPPQFLAKGIRWTWSMEIDRIRFARGDR